MVDITHKSNTLRTAVASAILTVSSEDTINAINNNEVPKGNIFEMGKAAGLLAIKKTSDVIPDCHPMPVEAASVSYEIKGLDIHIEVSVKTIYKTGVEVEAMHGAAIVALTLYDMLKPLDKGIEIAHVKLVSKKGGKSDFSQMGKYHLKGSILVCSSAIKEGEREDKVTGVIREYFEKNSISLNQSLQLPDEEAAIAGQVKKCCEEGDNLVIAVGGTGLTPGDITPESIIPLLDKRVPGIEEAVRHYGQQRMPYAMFSRSVAGLIGKTIVLVLPGSSKGIRESLDALFPHLLHAFRTLRDK